MHCLLSLHLQVLPIKFELIKVTGMPSAANLKKLVPVVERTNREASTDAEPVVHLVHLSSPGSTAGKSSRRAPRPT